MTSASLVPPPSPYTPGTAPRVLAGRREQIASAEADLALVATYGRFLGRVRVEIGSRGVGKTSLLKRVRDAADQAGLVTAWVTARGDESLVAALVHGVMRGLEERGVEGAKPSLRDRLRTMSLELGTGPLKGGVELDVGPGGRSGGVSGAARSADLAAFVTLASRLARDRGGAGLCLLVDEVQAAPREDLRTVAYAWQELQNAVPEPAAVLFAAGLPNAPDVLTAAVTFSERFAFRTLERLEDADAADALVAPAARLHVGWDPALVTEVVDLAQGYPYFLQLYGDGLWRVARPAAGSTLDASYLPAARREVDTELATMFRARWAKAAPAEQRLLAAMAALEAEQGVDAVRRGDVADRLDVSSNDLSVARRSLLDKGLVEVAARGLLRFTVPGFGEFVRGEAGES